MSAPPRPLAELSAFLSPDELSHAEACSPEVAARNATSRGLLRLLLSRHLNTDPGAITFQRNEHGKPQTCDDCGGLHFNVSHSGDVLLIGLSSAGEIGVDVEEHLQRYWRRLAKRFYSPAENNALAEAGVGAFDLFYRFWVRKEAWFKCLGTGLKFPLSDYCVGYSSAETEVTAGPGEAVWIRDLWAREGYSAAVATREQAQSVTRFRWNGLWPEPT